MKKLIATTLLACAILSTNVFSAQLPPVAQKVKNIAEKNKLLYSPECTDYLYMPDSEPGIDSVIVVEKHEGRCPGDPGTQPRLFTVNIDQKTHEMTSDINDPAEPEFSAFPAK
ncbi:hypothetical protein QQF21_03190 [Lelliottia sp. V89_10]|uniref:hypothetical protein n=1 Tax=Lelliottia wanjuensis TaxID=3050585 RepID=UPI00249E8021|nr:MULTISPECIES: hypothetical protein [unclassified Lelliottia]MDI3361893.1 hypothetical protein [Lelliottia sp. V89_13]MDK9550648.1 hypothetical protein [Lelliottia sp. V89_5]MDK9594616.1 hypothetical protein [Lelliottia sp. V89_10]